MEKVMDTCNRALTANRSHRTRVSASIQFLDTGYGRR